MKKYLQIDFVRFCIVGSVGFFVTLALKSSVFKNIETTLAFFLSSEGGMLSNFVFHEKWTYNQVDHHDKSIAKKFLHFQLSSLSGIVILTAISSVGVNVFHLSDFFSLAIAAGITMFWNYFWTKFYIFKGKTPAPLLNPEDTVPEKVVGPGR